MSNSDSTDPLPEDPASGENTTHPPPAIPPRRRNPNLFERFGSPALSLACAAWSAFHHAGPDLADLASLLPPLFQITRGLLSRRRDSDA
ncbi:hypothetical protein GCM10018987_05780 [Streptomyces cremeus]